MGELEQALIDRHHLFRGFLERRVESREAAEDILQQVWVRLSEAPPRTLDEEGASQFFYRALRNAVVDHYRRRAAAGRALEREAALSEGEVFEPELMAQICQCVEGVMAQLPAAQRDLLRRVDVDGQAPVEAAQQLGISAGNARVRLHRARQALKKELIACCGKCSENGCLDCGCDPR